MATEIVVTESDGPTIRQMTFNLKNNVLEKVLAALDGEPSYGRVVRVDKLDSPSLTPTLMLLRLQREAARELTASGEVRCLKCEHECANIGPFDGKDWWQCLECNNIFGRCVPLNERDGGGT